MFQQIHHRREILDNSDSEKVTSLRREILATDGQHVLGHVTTFRTLLYTSHIQYGGSALHTQTHFTQGGYSLSNILYIIKDLITININTLNLDIRRLS